MSFYVVNYNAPLAMDINGSQRLNVGSFRGTQVGFLDDFLQTVDGVIGVGQHVFIHLLDGIVVVFDGFLNFVSGIFGIFQAPRFGVAFGTYWGMFGVFYWMVRGIRSWVMGRRVMGGWVVGDGMVGGIRFRGGVIRSWGVWGGGISVWGRGGCVPVRGGSWVVGGWMMGNWVVRDGVVGMSSVGVSRDCGNQSGDDHQTIHGL